LPTRRSSDLVLPARLKEELEDIQAFLLGDPSDVADYHLDWAKQIKKDYGTFAHPEEVESVLQKELGSKFARVLEDAGVFKQNTAGQEAFKRFINALNN